MTLFIAPTEPVPLRNIGTTSIVPERSGVDILWATPSAERWGIQRKEIKDFLASRDDGRLAKELGQMTNLDQAVLLIEGRLAYTNEGELMGPWMNVSRRQLKGMLWSCRMRGVWVEFTESLNETIEVAHWLWSWSQKERHSGMKGRPNPRGEWGTASSREWGVHLLSGMDGIGPVMAERIYDHFGGVPMQWSVGADELLEIEGIGKGRASKLLRALERSES